MSSTSSSSGRQQRSQETANPMMVYPFAGKRLQAPRGCRIRTRGRRQDPSAIVKKWQIFGQFDPPASNKI
jgi:hypothetical protein